MFSYIGKKGGKPPRRPLHPKGRKRGGVGKYAAAGADVVNVRREKYSTLNPEEKRSTLHPRIRKGRRFGGARKRIKRRGGDIRRFFQGWGRVFTLSHVKGKGHKYIHKRGRAKYKRGIKTSIRGDGNASSRCCVKRGGGDTNWGGGKSQNGLTPLGPFAGGRSYKVKPFKKVCLQGEKCGKEAAMEISWDKE